MSEYIEEEYIGWIDYSYDDSPIPIIDQNQEIVRCRDCAYSRIHDGTRFPKDEIYKGATYCIAWSDGYQGEWTKPDGFCHKAKRKVDA